MKFKDLWIKAPAEEQAGETAHVEQATAAPPRPESRSMTSVPSGPAARPAAGDPGPFLKQLEDALEKANLPSHQDYLDFSKALKNMDALPMDEATKFKAAYATLQSFGCDVKQLLESFDFYNGILDGEKDKFNEALRSTVHEAVGEKEETVTTLTAEITKDTEEIGKLTASINANQETITRLQSELAEIKGKLTQREADFNAAYAVMTQRLQADAQKIRIYLKP